MEAVLTLTAVTFPKPGMRNPFRRINLTLRSSIAALVCAGLMAVTVGCTSTDVKTAVQEMANAIPTVQPYLATAAAVAESLDPGAALIISGATAAVQTSLTTLQALLQSYANSPSATVWGSIVDTVTALVNTNAAVLLNAVHIVDPESRAKAVAVLGALQAALLLVMSIVQRVHDAVTQAKLAAAAQVTPTKVSMYQQYLPHQQIEQATGVSFDTAVAYETSHGF